MKIAVFGSGMVGRRVIQEALSRSHDVTVMIRSPEKLDLTHPHLRVEKGDAMNAADIARVAKDHDCVICAVRNAPGGTDTAEIASHCIAVLPSLGIKRMMMIAGAGMTEVSPGLKLFDTPGYPPHVRVGSIRHEEAMTRLLASDLDFGLFSPAETIKPGERTGKFRTGVGKLIRDASGTSFISAEDYAIAMIDEIERPQYVRQNFVIAY